MGDNPEVLVVPSWLTSLWPNLSAAASDGRVWQAIAAAIAIGGSSFAFGTWATRRIGLLRRNAPAGEVVAVGLGSGLLILTSFWAAIASAGRSSFVPVAVAFAAAIVVSRRASSKGSTSSDPSIEASAFPFAKNTVARWPIAISLAGAVALVVVLGLLYGATMAPSPRDGQQPVDFMDAAYYSILGRDLALTGTESIYSPSGFDQIPGLPPQTWYHWGEMWLSASAITLFGLDPIFARHYVALPLLLVAAAALTGTLVRRITGATTRAAFMFGAAASLLLAPLPVTGTFFAQWPRNLIFGISMYGMVAVIVLLGMYLLVEYDRRPPNRAGSVLFGGVIASVIPAHLVIALLAASGVGGVILFRWVRDLGTGRPALAVPLSWRPALVASALVVAATAAWGVATGHGIGTTGLSPGVPPFNSSWRDSLALNLLGSGAFLAIFAALVVKDPRGKWLPLIVAGTVCLLTVGAIAWGARLGDFTMFHAFYGGIAVFATPVAVIAIWALWRELRTRGRPRLAVAMIVLAGAQIELGVATGIVRLQDFGPGSYDPIPLTLLSAISRLPPDAKVAYACRPLEEIGFFWDPMLVSIDAHTGHRVVPLCFQAEYFRPFNGSERTPDLISPQFQLAPQRVIYPEAAARPSSASVAGFMKDYGIDYIYADAMHPNSLVPDALPVASSGSTQLLRIP